METRTRELLNGFVRSLARRGITPEAYFAATGVTETALIAQLHGEAAQSVARELALEAVAARAGIEISDDAVKEMIREQAEAGGEEPEQLIEDVWTHGQQEALREDLRLRAALDRLAADVRADLDRAGRGAREALDARKGKTRHRDETVDPR